MTVLTDSNVNIMGLLVF